MFPKNSAWDQLPEPEDKPEPHPHVSAEPDGVWVPTAVFEQWVDQLDRLSDMRGGEEIGYLVDQMRSHFSG